MAQFDSALKWNQATQTLSGWTEIKGKQVFVCVPREMIHRQLADYNDLVEWEIEALKETIVRRLTPHLS